jgi:hypothetical protein
MQVGACEGRALAALQREAGRGHARRHDGHGRSA